MLKVVNPSTLLAPRWGPEANDGKEAGWKEIAFTIYHNYRSFDAFIVLHGTDSLAYTSSALSFMLQNLGKPVILT